MKKINKTAVKNKINKVANLSIRSLIVLTFMATLFISIGVTSIIIFSSWTKSAQNMTRHLSATMMQGLYSKVDDELEVLSHISKANHKIVKNGILNIADEQAREKFFVGLLEEHSDRISCVAYATAQGDYYGACRGRKEQDNEVTVRLLRKDSATGGNLYSFSVGEDATATGFIEDFGAFNPIERLWYTTAIETAKTTTKDDLLTAYSPIYKNFALDSFSIAASCPVIDDDGTIMGVFVANMLVEDMQRYVAVAVEGRGGIGVMFEKDNKSMIANSLGLDNLSIDAEGEPIRNSLANIDTDLQKAYDNYLANSKKQFDFKYNNKKWNFVVKEYNYSGVSWVMMAALPSDLMTLSVYKIIYITLGIMAASIILAFAAFSLISSKLIQPLGKLAQTAESIAMGNFSKRAEVTVKNGEVASIAIMFNQMAENIEFLVNNLEETVHKRTEDLKSSEAQLRLLLDSAAEGIYGVDSDHKCTFCNASCVRMLGYTSSDELVGKNIHTQIHYKKIDGADYESCECVIEDAIQKGKKVHCSNEVFWRADGTPFFVEYHAYPQVIDGKIIGAVVTFTDITERKKREEEINYLSYHDVLTGLLNRRGYEKEVAKIDTEENLPISVFFADVNGLKMTNDIFGHAKGDELILKTAQTLSSFCNTNDIIARVGGDEFVIIMKNTDKAASDEVVSKVKAAFAKARVAAIKCSVSIGADTKTEADQSLEVTMLNAEKIMYQDKTLNRKTVNKDTINTIIDALHGKRSNEKRHSEQVEILCGRVGEALGMPKPEITRLKQAGYMHDIGKVVLEDNILGKAQLNDEEREKMRQHSIVGYRILNLFDETLDLADGVYSHHEHWDGSGYPKGLKGAAIPIISRIISITETYERIFEREKPKGIDIAKQFAINEIKKGAGTAFDPEIADIFIKVMSDKYI